MKVHRLIVPIVLAAATAALAMRQAPGNFPHALHAKLFPTCAGCHAGIFDGDTSHLFPTKDVCAQCHNGTDVRQIAWNGPTPHATNLRFSHTLHTMMSKAAGTPAECANCHGAQAGRDTAWMHVVGADPSACIQCHRHQAPEHLASTAQCATCHKPLVQATALSASTIAAFPKPPSHSDSNWLAAHAPTTGAQASQCAVCHARQSCARCHPNADLLPAIRALGADDRVASLVANRAPAYFTPASHKTDSWAHGHGADARANPQTCASCHTQSSCLTCHLGTLGKDVIGQLAEAKPGRAPGVVLTMAAPRLPAGVTLGAGKVENAALLLAAAHDTVRAVVVRMHPDDFATNHATVATSGKLNCLGCHAQSTFCAQCHSGMQSNGLPAAIHPPGWATNHKVVAASGRMNCQACHQPRDCTSCHDGVSTRRNFHPDDFVARHATSAYAQTQNCSTCHSVETFCRSCHEKSGIANTAGVRGPAHNNQPLWLLQHGQAARQGLTSCTACHQQRDCLRCHSDLGLHMNPHGPNFNAQQMQAKNPQMCLICHLTDPLKR